MAGLFTAFTAQRTWNIRSELVTRNVTVTTHEDAETVHPPDILLQDIQSPVVYLKGKIEGQLI